MMFDWQCFEKGLEHRALIEAYQNAVWAIPPHLRVRIVEATLAALRPEPPEFLVPELFVLEAEEWVQVAGWQLVRIMLWAIWKHAPDELMASFLAHANGREAA